MATRGWESVKAIVSPAKPPRQRVQRPVVTRSKFGAIRTEVDGITFASKAEAARYSVLKLAERGGYIVGLELQPRFELRAENGSKVSVYVADFAYWEKPGAAHVTGRAEGITALTYVVEDVKGFKTPAYRLKKRHFEAQYGIQIREIR
jgi:hypothetical protein